MLLTVILLSLPYDNVLSLSAFVCIYGFVCVRRASHVVIFGKTTIHERSEASAFLLQVLSFYKMIITLKSTQWKN
jgi:hypothetical protein